MTNADSPHAEPEPRPFQQPPYSSPDPAVTRETRTLPFEFHGKGMEYFKIWLVNIILSVLTLGIYSAWAKVRRKQYFYGNTTLNGARFEYLADPKNILKGRIIVFVIFVGYSVVSELNPIVGFVLTLLFLLIIPWLVVRSVTFNFRNSAYKNIRFNFHGRVWDAVKAYALLPLTVPLTLGLSLPYVYYRQRKFIADNAGYGDTRFQFHARAGSYYRLGLGALLPMLAGGILVGISMAVFPPITFMFMMVLYLYLFAYISIATTNLFYNSTRLEDHGFDAHLRVKGYMWVVVVNTIGTMLTLGLYYPWARVRTARYRLEHMDLVARGDLDHFTAGVQERVSALGEEVGDFFDMDLGF